MEVLRNVPKEDIRRADKAMEEAVRSLAARRAHLFDVEVVEGNPHITVIIRKLDGRLDPAELGYARCSRCGRWIPGGTACACDINKR